jgi:hypothetical protein
VTLFIINNSLKGKTVKIRYAPAGAVYGDEKSNTIDMNCKTTAIICGKVLLVE